VNVERKAEQIAQHEASPILLCTKTRRLWGLASIVRSFFFHVMGTTTTCCRPVFIDLCALLGISFSCWRDILGQYKGLGRGLAWGGRSAEAQYDALRHQIGPFWTFSRNLWCLIKDFTGFGGGWYVCLLSVQAQKCCMQGWLGLGG
jgi:hypothetical protein